MQENYYKRNHTPDTIQLVKSAYWRATYNNGNKTVPEIRKKSYQDLEPYRTVKDCKVTWSSERKILAPNILLHKELKKRSLV